MGISSKVIKLIGYGKYRFLLTSIMRTINGVHEKISYSDNVESVEEYSVNNKHCFFGYYDLRSISFDNKKLLSLVCDENEKADVGYFNIAEKNFVRIAETNAWNWQMGARIRWHNNDNEIIFNDYDGKQFISRIVDIEGNEVERYPFPIYDIDEQNQVGYYTDFTILHYLRKGYGYGNKNVDFEDYYRQTSNGVFWGDLSDKRVGVLLSMNEIKNYEYMDVFETSYHYINHISVNPHNGNVMFFHLWTDGKKTANNRIFIMNPEGRIVNMLSDFHRASHYCWKDDVHILVTVIINGKTEYRLYNYISGEYKIIQGILTDGHPTYINDSCFITDTYPDRGAMENVYICDEGKESYHRLFSIYHNLDKQGEYRCDLHPRIGDNVVNIDSHQDKYRKQYLIRVQNQKIKFEENNITINCKARNKKINSLYKNMKEEYLFATRKEVANPIKVLYNWFFGPTFRVNVWVAKMQNSKSAFVKKLIRNHLEMKYSITVDERCQIGKHFRVDHFHGVVIGPGAVLGNYCKLYQQVTIGQREGKFPKIGNHVTIYSGAKIIGDVEIGDYSIIGANAVVNKDVPPNSVVAGVPAKVIKQREF